MKRLYKIGLFCAFILCLRFAFVYYFNESKEGSSKFVDMGSKHALISVYDKSKVVPFAKGLHELGYKLVATSGTAKLLRSNKIPVIEVSELTKEPELFSGRLKTLSPKIFGGILFNRNKISDFLQSKIQGIPSIDIVVVNLYPFKEKALKKGLNLKEAIEFIDIGGPSLLRSAAKNWEHSLAVSTQESYPLVLKALQSNTLTERLRIQLATQAFQLVLHYDEMVFSYFKKNLDQFDDTPLPLASTL